jgi:hypothetical protein
MTDAVNSAPVVVRPDATAPLHVPAHIIGVPETSHLFVGSDQQAAFRELAATCAAAAKRAKRFVSRRRPYKIPRICSATRVVRDTEISVMCGIAYTPHQADVLRHAAWRSGWEFWTDPLCVPRNLGRKTTCDAQVAASFAIDHAVRAVVDSRTCMCPDRIAKYRSLE